MAEASEISLRLAGADDFGWLDHVAPDLFDEEPTKEFLKTFLAAKGHSLLLAECDKTVVGKCSAMIHWRPDKPAELYIDEIDVTPEVRKQGIAKQMLAKMLNLADEWDCEEAWVGTEKDNIAARKLYESNGAKAEEFVLYYMEY